MYVYLPAAIHATHGLNTAIDAPERIKTFSQAYKALVWYGPADEHGSATVVEPQLTEKQVAAALDAYSPPTADPVGDDPRMVELIDRLVTAGVVPAEKAASLKKRSSGSGSPSVA